ncbi:MAG: 50S ribosomal protein L6 [Candidatus Staskawiczbacteria bacterium RIFOXYD1_FULL_39_28]|uniref:Large ribosomal subunit protein uL6 n=1 Tax=Candidatus Staskawiczbacteria bacterium RIFOXYC1_FULL_38_18 TaxID=1802229 RepID=A0A1G2JF41_9BACT|nr:MAG: 50S ribosomal protein L6 [Candidatus Staskawiczbacteria bacterium RIFOXYC1_FULL_38_18]OGZ90273.1 MAG: 50S ribosomal protein L6 [Candidatus Staskawiczbacteria bacterium RIFOXYD1_FULL_39_28]
MSRIGKKLIEIPAGVTVTISEKEITVKGPKGELKQAIHPEIKIESKDGKIFVSPKSELSKKGRGLWGLYRALVANMVEGTSKGFEKKLEIEGVGFKASVDAEGITLNVGFTNPIKIKKIDGVDFKVEKNIITVSGVDKERVGHMAAEIRKQKKVEPYKGKGIKYQGERVRRKEGKKVVASK